MDNKAHAVLELINNDKNELMATIRTMALLNTKLSEYGTLLESFETRNERTCTVVLMTLGHEEYTYIREVCNEVYDDVKYWAIHYIMQGNK